MSDETNKPAPSASVVPATPPTIGTVTRSQQNRQNTAEPDANDDEDSPAPTTEKKKEKKEHEVFKGKVAELEGNVFQLPEEGRKANQFTKTMKAIKRYASLKYEHADDLTSLFESPCTTPTIPLPPDLPPTLPGTTTQVPKEHRLYYSWKHACALSNTRTNALATNQHKLFTVILSQCSQSVTNNIEYTEKYDVEQAANNCTWLITTLTNICHSFTTKRTVSCL